MANEGEALAIQKALETVPYSVSKIVQQEKQRHPFPPFITSRLQQEAYRKLSFPAQKTMWIAQKLYEGVDLGEMGMVGLITYMRTDSVRVSTEAIQQVRDGLRIALEILIFLINQMSIKAAEEPRRPMRPFGPLQLNWNLTK